MDLISAIKQYFHGESKSEKVLKFETLYKSINDYRNDISEMTATVNEMISGVDSIRKAADMVIKDPSSTAEVVAIALDNVRFSDASLNNYMSQFSSDINEKKNMLIKAEKELSKIISDNVDMAVIISDVNHDNMLKKALDTVFKQYKSGDIERSVAIFAYKSAMSKRRTDMSFESILNENLKDN